MTQLIRTSSFVQGRAPAYNNEKRDARLLYIMVLASPRTHYRLRGVRGDSFLANVMRHAPYDKTKYDGVLHC